MPAKVVYTSREDKQELQKQLGCMNGIFQLFDRRYLLGQRRGQNQKRLPPGQSDNGEEAFENASEKAKGKNQRKVVKEKHRVSVESSRNSFSSSSCSSTTFSSVECSKRVQTEQSSFCQSLVSEPSSPTLPRKLPDLFTQPPDIRDVVKDSMTREPRMISVKPVAKDERVGPAMKHVDSPRPFQQPTSVPYDRKDRNLEKLREISWGTKEIKETPRFSYDGRESRYSLKSTVKMKELPRLSLDSKQSSIRKSENESRRNLLIRETRGSREAERSSSQNLNQHHEPGSNKRPSSGVVARLMGLEVLTDSINEGETSKNNPSLDGELVPTSRLSRRGEEFKHNQISNSPRVHKEPASRQAGVSYAITRIPLEPAPWKQEGGRQASPKTPFKHKEAPERAEHAAPSVYGEIEKRLTKLEFKTSGKDLRALKQILEAMQKTRRGLENKEQPLDNSSFDHRQSQIGDQPVSPTIKGTGPLTRRELSNSVIKPARRTTDSVMVTGLQKLRKVNHGNGKEDLVCRQQGKDLSPRNKKGNGRIQRPSSPSNMPEYLTGEKSTSSRNSGTISPRLQRSKSGEDNQSVIGPSSDISRLRNQTSKQAGSLSKARHLKTKSINQLQNNEELCGPGSDTRNSSTQRGDAVSFQSESNTNLASQSETEATSTDWTQGISISRPKDNHRNSFAERLIEEKPMAELATVLLEQPSPVSVLDAFYTEDPPSPVKKKTNTFKDDENLNYDETEWNQAGIDSMVSSTDDCQHPEFNHIKLENIKHLVHQIELLNSTNEEATINHSASPCEGENGDHIYISEILLASGFLKDLNSAITIVQLHPTGSLINPELFHVLEKTKGCIELTDDEYHEKKGRSILNEKIRRKMVFDTVNDILIQKLAMSGSSGLWSSKRKGRILNGEKLLRELCSEIENLQANSDRGLDDEDDEVINIINADVNRKSEDWEEYCHEVPGLVLDIERMIFKDLISEVVNAEVGQQDWPRKNCRQLFPM